MSTRAWSFVGLAYLFSWGLAALAWVIGVPFKGLGGAAIGVLFMWGPGLAALLLARREGRAIGALFGLKVRPSRVWVLAWVGPLLLAWITLAVGAALPGVSWSPAFDALLSRFGDALPPEAVAQLAEKVEGRDLFIFALASIAALVAGPTVNALAAIGEELGWRGYLHVETEGLGFWRQSILVGALWGLWHAPLILQGHNYPSAPGLGVGAMVLACVAMSPVLTWLRARAGTVWVAAIFHGGVNAAAGLSLLFISGGSEFLVGTMGLAGMISYLGVALLLPRAQPGAP